MAAPEWDLFCRVIDNHGDAGVCWRLAADLAARGQPVRLWIDDPSALVGMAPGGAAGVSVLPWPLPAVGEDGPCFSPGPVVIEAFGCDLPPGFVAAMAAMARPPVWIDLEYLSAEDYVERSHRLPSPQTVGPGADKAGQVSIGQPSIGDASICHFPGHHFPGHHFSGHHFSGHHILGHHFSGHHILVRHFYYPGFSAATGGLIREPTLASEQAAFDAAAWLGRFGLERRPGERLVSLFCYEQPALAALLDRLAEVPTLLLLTAGAAERQARPFLAEPSRHPGVRMAALPWLTQADYDRLLWSCDLNFVRGEDSFVRAQWAGTPFVWQAYPQAEGHHLVKVEAFLRRHLADVDAGVAEPTRQLWTAWNGGGPTTALPWPPLAGWVQACRDWRTRLQAQTDLVSQLRSFVTEIASRSG